MKKDELTSRTIKNITDEFKNLLNNNPNYDNQYFEKAKTSKKEAWLEKIKQDYHSNSLMFTGDQFSPNINLIIECQERKDKRYTL